MAIETIGLSVDPRPSEAGLKRVRDSLSLTDKAGHQTQDTLAGIGPATQKGAAQASQSLGKMTAGLNSAARAAGLYADAQGRIRQANGRFATDAQKAAAGLDNVSKSASRASLSFKDMRSNLLGLKSFLSGLALGAVAKSIIQTADSYQLLAGRLRQVAGPTTDLAALQERLFQLAQDVRAPVAEVTDLYIKQARALQQLGANQSQILDLTRTVGQSFQISGASAAEASAGILQFGQALESGVLQGDELRSIRENAPRLFKAIVEGIQEVNPALGVTRANFRDLAAEGQITAGTIAKALLSQKDVIEREFATVPRTVGQAFQQLQNEISRSVGTADTSPIIRAIDDLREKVKDPTFQQGLVDTATNLAKIVALLARAGGAVAGGITDTLDAIADKKRASEIRGLELQIQGLEQSIEKFQGPGRFVLQAFGRDTQAEVVTMTEKVKLLKDELASLTAPAAAPVIPLSPAAPASASTGNISDFAGGGKARKEQITEAQRLIESLREQLALYGELSKAEEVRISLANGFYGKVTPAQATQLQGLADEITRRDQLTQSIKDEIDAEAKLIAEHEKLREEGKAVWEATRTPLEAYNLEIDRLSELLRQGAIDQETFARASVQASEGLSALAEKTKDATDDMKAFADQAARNIQDAFADFLFDPFDKGLKGMLQSFEETLRRMAANQAAAQILGGLSSAAGGSGLLGQAISFGMSIFGGGSPGDAVAGDIAGAGPGGLGVGTLGGRAIGGEVYPGMAYSVGEMGRERFTPYVRGRIEPAANDVQPTTINIHVPINAPDGAVTPKTRQQVATDVGREVRRAMARFT
jgi:tape measure domain-containing protein